MELSELEFLSLLGFLLALVVIGASSCLVGIRLLLLTRGRR